MLRRTVFCGSCMIMCIFAAIPVGRTAAHAQVVDMAGVVCAEFDRLHSQRKRSIAVWLHGYYAGVGQRPLLDLGQIEEAVNALMAHCEDDPEAPLVGAKTAEILRGNGPVEAGSGMRGSRSGHRIVVPPDAPRDPPRGMEGPGNFERPGAELPASPSPAPRPRPVD